MEKVIRIKISTFCAAIISLSFLAATNTASSIPGSSFVYPLVGTRISSNFGQRSHPIKKAIRHHSGIDLAAPYGSQIRAVRAGTVVFSDPYAGYGNLIVVLHKDGMTTHYGHCRTILVKPGQKLSAGQIIGTVGSTGLSSGPHLHFEIRIKGVPQNPEHYLPGLAKEAVG